MHAKKNSSFIFHDTGVKKLDDEYATLHLPKIDREIFFAHRDPQLGFILLSCSLYYVFPKTPSCCILNRICCDEMYVVVKIGIVVLEIGNKVFALYSDLLFFNLLALLHDIKIATLLAIYDGKKQCVDHSCK